MEDNALAYPFLLLTCYANLTYSLVYRMFTRKLTAKIPIDIVAKPLMFCRVVLGGHNVLFWLFKCTMLLRVCTWYDFSWVVSVVQWYCLTLACCNSGGTVMVL